MAGETVLWARRTLRNAFFLFAIALAIAGFDTAGRAQNPQLSPGCQRVDGLLARTLPVAPAGPGISPAGDLGTAGARKELTRLAAVYRAGWTAAADVSGNENPSFGPLAADFEHYFGSLDASRDTSTAFWLRSYRTPGRAAPAESNTQAEARRAAGVMAAEILDDLAENGGGGTGTDAEDTCAHLRTTLAEAATWALIEDARRRAVRNEPPLAGFANAIEHAGGLLGFDAEGCQTAASCVLAAQLALSRSERAALAGTAAAERAVARRFAQEALRRAAPDRPDLPAAEAWMVLAELEAAGSGRLGSEQVRQAYATLAAIALFSEQSPGAQEVARRTSRFRYRLLPIFQAAVDDAHDRQRSAAEAGDVRLRELLAIGETARRAQVESTLADGCERLDIPLSPGELRPGETILYPVVGSNRTYLLIGRRPVSRGESGWRLLASPEGSGAARMSDLADRLLARMPIATAEETRLNGDPDWGREDAMALHAQLIQPLMDAGLSLDGGDATHAGNARGAGNEVAGSPRPVLIVFPDPVLRNVPWALLHGDPVRRDYLITRTAIATGPALAYVRPSVAPAHRGGMLAAGFDRDYRTASPLLSEAARADAPEADGLEQFVGLVGSPGFRARYRLATDSTLVGPRFTERNLRAGLERGNVSVLLLAAHAQFGHGESRIYVSAEPSASPGSFHEMDPQAIQTALRTIRRRERALDLLILLSCEGAAGDASDLGIAGMALRSGATATIGSVIRVRAETAIQLFAREPRDDGGSEPVILDQYFGGRSPAEALRVAQLERNFDYPPTWGVYVVVGNWR